MTRQGSQVGQLTVGDTTTVVYRVAVPPGSLVQPRLPTDTTLATVLGLPNVTREGDSVRIAFTLTVWAPGRNSLTVPGAVVVGTDGRIDTLPDARLVLEVASVLPPGRPVASVAPRQARPWVVRADRSWLPWGVAAALLVAATAVGIWRWRRRGPLPPPPRPLERPAPDPARFAAWLAAGEAQLVLQHLEPLLHERPDAATWRDRAAELRFMPSAGNEVDELAREGIRLLTGEVA